MVLITGNSKRARSRHLQNGPVDKAKMVSEQEYRAFRRDIVQAENLQAVRAEERAEKRTEKRLWQML